MKQPLPLALRTVMDGRLTMRQAHSLWAYAAYGVSPADDAESQARAMNFCRRDLSPWLFSGPLDDPNNAWIDFQALAGLAAMHHVDLDIDFIHTSSADMAAAFRQAYTAPPSALVAPVVTLEQALKGDRQVAPGGRPSTNAPAYLYMDDLMADGMNLRNACSAARIKFPKGDPEKREASLYTGYIQYRRKRMSEANKPL